MTETPEPRLYAADPDVARTWPIYDHGDPATGGLPAELDYVVMVRIDGDEALDRPGEWVGATTETTWKGRPAATRLLRVPLTGLDPGSHDVVALVAGGNDVWLGTPYLH